MRNFNGLTGHFLVCGRLKIFPCQEGGPSAKAPYTQRGFKDATNDSAVITSWCSRFPNAVWGLPCAENGVLVLDADRHGKGDGVGNLMRLFEHHQFDCHQVPIVTTPRGGRHFYFQRPDRLGPTKATLCDAVDVRDNAYVISPGCVMTDGGRYDLISGTIVDLADYIVSRKLLLPPAWLISLLIRPTSSSRHEVRPLIGDENLQNQMRGIIRAILNAQDGQRNLVLYWAACRFAEFVRDDLILHDFAEALLEEAGSRVGLPARETRATVASGLRKALEGDSDAR